MENEEEEAHEVIDIDPEPESELPKLDDIPNS